MPAFIVVILLSLSPLAPRASEVLDEPRSYLQFEAKIDGKCHNLSAGGKLQIMRNAHPTRSIDFRLIRYYIDVRQRGRATGIAPAGGEVVKLGCTLVGGRPQRWEIERARFIEVGAQ